MRVRDPQGDFHCVQAGPQNRIGLRLQIAGDHKKQHEQQTGRPQEPLTQTQPAKLRVCFPGRTWCSGGRPASRVWRSAHGVFVSRTQEFARRLGVSPHEPPSAQSTTQNWSPKIGLARLKTDCSLRQIHSNRYRMPILPRYGAVAPERCRTSVHRTHTCLHEMRWQRVASFQ